MKQIPLFILTRPQQMQAIIQVMTAMKVWKQILTFRILQIKLLRPNMPKPYLKDPGIVEA